jgi:hypothetical protein
MIALWRKLDIFARYILVLSVASYLIVSKGAIDEPYDSLIISDAIEQVGIGMSLIVLWLHVMAIILPRVMRGKLSRLWLLVLVWGAINLFYLYQSPSGYLSDISRIPGITRRLNSDTSPTSVRNHTTIRVPAESRCSIASTLETAPLARGIFASTDAGLAAKAARAGAIGVQC